MKIKTAILALGLILVSCNAHAGKTPTPSQSETADRAANYVVEFNGSQITPDSSLPIIIDFNADWCGPCRWFKPIFHQVAEEYSSRAKFLSVNVDNCPEVAEQFRVMAIPQITILYPDGTIDSRVGAMELDEFQAVVDSWLAK